MSVRIVEESLQKCQAVVMNALEEAGYVFEQSKIANQEMRAFYSRATRTSLLYKLPLTARFMMISSQKTRVEIVSFLRAGRMALLILLGFLVGFSPYIILKFFDLSPQYLQELAKTSPVMLAIFIDIFTLWALLCNLGVCHLIFFTVFKQKSRMESLIWCHLEKEGLLSHEIVDPSPGIRSGIRILKWCICCGIVCQCAWILQSEYRGITRGLLFLLGWTAFLSIAAQMEAGTKLPHRYHWKVRFSMFIMVWYIIVCSPAIFWCFHYDPRHATNPVTMEKFYWMISGIPAIMVLLVQATTLLDGIVVFPSTILKAMGESPKEFFAPPSTVFEENPQSISKDQNRVLFRRYRMWTWMVFVIMTGISYLAFGYLFLVTIEAISGLFGSSWGLIPRWPRPMLIPAEGIGAQVQVIVLSFVMGIPFVLGYTLAIKTYIRTLMRFRSGIKFGKSWDSVGIPEAPLERLRFKLRADVILIALVPLPSINVQLERSPTWKRKYLLWLSVGTLRNLNDQEMEALLWHECGHTGVLKDAFWRQVWRFLSPWNAGLIDLANDYYEEERQADAYAVRKMQCARPLMSALKKLDKQYDSPRQGHKSRANIHQHVKVFFEFLKKPFDQDWLGYLHPDVKQRLRWLKEIESKQNLK